MGPISASICSLNLDYDSAAFDIMKVYLIPRLPIFFNINDEFLSFGVMGVTRGFVSFNLVLDCLQRVRSTAVTRCENQVHRFVQYTLDVAEGYEE